MWMNKSEMTVGVLAGGDSTRFKSEKALAEFRGQPLLKTMTQIASAIAERVLVIASSEEQKSRLEAIIDSETIVVDPDESIRCALTGTLTALEYSETEYTMVLPVDTPLAKVPVLRTLVKLAPGHGAVVPIWPNGYIEPLHTVYFTEHAYGRGITSFEKGITKMSRFLDSLTNVLYVSTEVLKHQDPDLETFSNINTERELKKLERVTSKAKR